MSVDGVRKSDGLRYECLKCKQWQFQTLLCCCCASDISIYSFISFVYFVRLLITLAGMSFLHVVRCNVFACKLAVNFLTSCAWHLEHCQALHLLFIFFLFVCRLLDFMHSTKCASHCERVSFQLTQTLIFCCQHNFWA